MKKFLFPTLALALSTMAFAQGDSASSTSDKARYTSIFLSSDKDQDERLTPDEAYLAGLSEASFRSLDKDSDGYLSLEEFLTMVTTEE